MDHQEALKDTLLDWSKDDHDIYIVSDEGHKIFTQKILLYFYSQTLGNIMDSLPPSTSTAGVSVSASSSSISNLLKLLTTGRATSNNKDTLVNVKEAAKALGINLGNCLLEAKRNQGQVPTIIRKLPIKAEPKVSPANLSVFRNREPGIAGIAKWNTVITAKNKVTQIPANINSKEVISEETKEDEEEEKEDDQPKLPCDICSKVFRGKRNLRRHKNRKHQNRKEDISIVKVENPEDGTSEFQCNQCHLEFKSERKLVKHTLQHTNRFGCDGCDKSFQSSSTLKNHRNIHLDEKPFKCEICNKEFTQAGNLKTHRIRHHNASDTTHLDSSEISVAPVVVETDVIETDVVLETNDDNVNDDISENVTVDHCGYCDELFDDAAELNSHMVLMHSIQKMIESSD